MLTASLLILLVAGSAESDDPVTGSASTCPNATKYGTGPPANCEGPTDPNNKPASALESWFTREMFYDLFPFANLGWGPNKCSPYSYESFVVAARYFPDFGTVSPNTVYTADQNKKRDLAAFFAHSVQETGENNEDLNTKFTEKQQAANCFYRGGFYNWFMGGPNSVYLERSAPGYQPEDGDQCTSSGRFCRADMYFGCSNATTSEGENMEETYKACYLGRGALQIAYNDGYGLFQYWLKTQGIIVDLIASPNLVMTKMDPPLAMLASFWMYMFPQPPKPAAHDIMMGTWNGGAENTAAGFSGPIFGPTSVIVHGSCTGDDSSYNGILLGEARSIKAFKWFCQYFEVPTGPDNTLSCKAMPNQFYGRMNTSYDVDWNSPANKPCACIPSVMGKMPPYFDPNYYSAEYVKMNAAGKHQCEETLYANPALYHVDAQSLPCLNNPRK